MKTLKKNVKKINKLVNKNFKYNLSCRRGCELIYFDETKKNKLSIDICYKEIIHSYDEGMYSSATCAKSLKIDFIVKLNEILEGKYE